MLLRIRWMILGMLFVIGGGAVVISRLVKMRQRLSPANVRRQSAATAADGLDALAAALRGSRTLRS